MPGRAVPVEALRCRLWRAGRSESSGSCRPRRRWRRSACSSRPTTSRAPDPCPMRSCRETHCRSWRTYRPTQWTSTFPPAMSCPWALRPARQRPGRHDPVGRAGLRLGAHTVHRRRGPL